VSLMVEQPRTGIGSILPPPGAAAVSNQPTGENTDNIDIEEFKAEVKSFIRKLVAEDLNLGSQLVLVSEFPEAIRVLERAAETLQEDQEQSPILLAQTLVSLGNAYLGLWIKRDLDAEASDESLLTKAETTFRRSINVNPGQAEALFGLGAALYRLGRKQEAAEGFSVALRSEPQSVPTPHLRVIFGPALTGIWKQVNGRESGKPLSFAGVVSDIAEIRNNVMAQSAGRASILSSTNLVECLLPEVSQMSPRMRLRLAHNLFDAGLLSARDAVRLSLGDELEFESSQHNKHDSEAPEDEFERVLDSLSSRLENAGITLETLQAGLPEARSNVFHKYYPDLARAVEDDEGPEER
jgi:tetratricopeptide (TPR) repeat protein